MEVNTKNLALAGGILWGAAMLVFTLVSVWTGWANAFFNVMASIYPGFSVSYLGAGIGAVYGFVDVFIGLWLFGWIYNKLEERG